MKNILSARLVYIDGLKVIMILCVLINHVGEILEIKYSNFLQVWPEWGAAGVSGFIILSGFGLTYNLLAKNVTEIAFNSFFWKRFIRIVPLYYVALFTYWLIVELIPKKNLLVHLFFIHTFFEDFSHNPGSLWFIGLIVQCYLVFPFAYKILRQKKGVFFLSIAAILLYGIGLFFNRHGFYLSDSFLFYGIEFFLGMIIAQQAVKGKIEQYSFPIVMILTIVEVIGFALLVKTSVLYNWSDYIHLPITKLSRICFFIVVLNLFLILEKRWKYFKKLVPLVVEMSIASYSVYLFHRPLLAIFMRGSLWSWINSHVVSDSGKFICLSLISFPMIFLIGYWIQKTYDYLQKQIDNKFRSKMVT